MAGFGPDSLVCSESATGVESTDWRRADSQPELAALFPARAAALRGPASSPSEWTTRLDPADYLPDEPFGAGRPSADILDSLDDFWSGPPGARMGPTEAGEEKMADMESRLLDLTGKLEGYDLDQKALLQKLEEKDRILGDLLSRLGPMESALAKAETSKNEALRRLEDELRRMHEELAKKDAQIDDLKGGRAVLPSALKPPALRVDDLVGQLEDALDLPAELRTSPYAAPAPPEAAPRSGAVPAELPSASPAAEPAEKAAPEPPTEAAPAASEVPVIEIPLLASRPAVEAPTAPPLEEAVPEGPPEPEIEVLELKTWAKPLEAPEVIEPLLLRRGLAPIAPAPPAAPVPAAPVVHFESALPDVPAPAAAAPALPEAPAPLRAPDIPASVLSGPVAAVPPPPAPPAVPAPAAADDLVARLRQGSAIAEPKPPPPTQEEEMQRKMLAAKAELQARAAQLQALSAGLPAKIIGFLPSKLAAKLPPALVAKLPPNLQELLKARAGAVSAPAAATAAAPAPALKPAAVPKPAAASPAPAPAKPRRAGAFLLVMGMMVGVVCLVMFMLFRGERTELSHKETEETMPEAPPELGRKKAPAKAKTGTVPLDAGAQPGAEAAPGAPPAPNLGAAPGAAPAQPPSAVNAAAPGTAPAAPGLPPPAAGEGKGGGPSGAAPSSPAVAPPAVAPPAVAPPAAPAPIQLPKSVQALSFVKDYVLSGGRGTLSRWFQSSFLASPDHQEDWHATPLADSQFVVEYRVLTPGARGAVPMISYQFKADLDKSSLEGLNAEAKRLLSGGPPPRRKAKAKARRAKVARKPAVQARRAARPRAALAEEPEPVEPRPPKELPLLPLPSEEEGTP